MTPDPRILRYTALWLIPGSVLLGVALLAFGLVARRGDFAVAGAILLGSLILSGSVRENVLREPAAEPSAANSPPLPMTEIPTWPAMLVTLLVLVVPALISALPMLRGGKVSLRSLFVLTAVEAVLLAGLVYWFGARGVFFH